ncbi:MAG: DUF1467 family protein [Bdellovibrionales bacterium]
MGIVTGIIVFVLIWWVVLFAVLPFGHLRDADGTPQNPRLSQKAIWTTAITVIIWLGVFVVIQSDMISFQDMATRMMEDDYGQ